jgi:solute carrier family 10 (sodium/bile acid cotransporter), member 7
MVYHQQRGQCHAQNVGQRRADYRSRDIAPRNRRERDRRLHRRGNQAQKQQPVVLLMNTRGAPSVPAAAIRDVVVQLLLPFVAGQLLRPWLADTVARHTVLTKAVDRGSILLVVYTAFSIGVVEQHLDEGQPVAAGAGRCNHDRTVGRRAGLHHLGGSTGSAGSGRRDHAAVLRIEEESGLRAPDGAGAVSRRTVGLIMLPLMLFHQIQLVVCSVIASGLSRDKRQPEMTSAATRPVDPARPASSG